jgi:hypothetical protein
MRLAIKAALLVGVGIVVGATHKECSRRATAPTPVPIQKIKPERPENPARLKIGAPNPQCNPAPGNRCA